MIRHILSSIVEPIEHIGFDSDGYTFIFGNSANSHIRSKEYMFTEKIDPIISNGVAIIGIKYLHPKGI